MSQTPFEVLGACPHDCPDSCSLITTVEDGRAVQVRGNPAHSHTAGVLCAKVARYPERTHHPERLLHPLKRVGPKGSGRFERVSWDEALSDIAARLKAIAARDPQAILPYSYAGTMGLVQGESMDRRFFHRLGASRLDRTICASAGAAALEATLGGKLGMKVEHFAESRRTGKLPELLSSSPPARWRQAPISAGRQATARTALPPPRVRCMP